jgi:Tol biopolymer transport system component
MTQLRFAGVVALVAGSLALQAHVGAQTPRDPERQYKAARYKQEVQGDLKGAIEDYKKIAKGPDKVLAARALFAMGVSYQTLGAPDARAVFARIVRDYTEPMDVVTEARAKLAALGPARSQSVGLSPRLLQTGDGFRADDVTSDGRLAVGHVTNPLVQSPGDLAVHDLVTGRTTVLATASHAGYAVTAAVSADGRHVAYVWADQSTRPVLWWLKVIGTESGALARTLLPPDSSRANTFAAGWSPDGRSVLAVLARPNGIQDVAWISTADGTIKTIKSFDRSRGLGGRVKLSIDGGSIAFSAIARADSTDRHIYVMDANGQNETDVAGIAGSSTNPVWATDGGHLLFVSNRSGSPALWSVRMDSGKAAGEPTQLQSGLSGYLVGMSTAGAVYYRRFFEGGQSVFIAERTTSGARIVRSFDGGGVAWSPDNKTIAFLKGRQGGIDLFFRSLATGEERRYTHAGLGQAQLRWLHDSSAVIAMVQPEGDAGRAGGALYLVDATSGSFKRLLGRYSEAYLRHPTSDVSPDDATIYAVVREYPESPQTPWKAIVGTDLATGVERRVVTFPGSGLSDGAPGLAVSPDGTVLAILASAGEPAKGGRRIITVGIDGTNYREQYVPFVSGATNSVVRWTPDGQSILFLATQPSGDVRLMRIPRNGGQPELADMGSSILQSGSGSSLWRGIPLSLDLSPDGSQIAFGALRSSTHELWVLENVGTVLAARR